MKFDLWMCIACVVSFLYMACFFGILIHQEMFA
jgi:hypothetical protein